MYSRDKESSHENLTTISTWGKEILYHTDVCTYYRGYFERWKKTLAFRLGVSLFLFLKTFRVIVLPRC